MLSLSLYFRLHLLLALPVDRVQVAASERHRVYYIMEHLTITIHYDLEIIHYGAYTLWGIYIIEQAAAFGAQPGYYIRS